MRSLIRRRLHLQLVDNKVETCLTFKNWLCSFFLSFWQSQALQYFILVRHILGLILFSYLAGHNWYSAWCILAQPFKNFLFSAPNYSNWILCIQPLPACSHKPGGHNRLFVCLKVAQQVSYSIYEMTTAVCGNRLRWPLLMEYWCSGAGKYGPPLGPLTLGVIAPLLIVQHRFSGSWPGFENLTSRHLNSRPWALA